MKGKHKKYEGTKDYFLSKELLKQFKDSRKFAFFIYEIYKCGRELFQTLDNFIAIFEMKQ